MSTGDLEWWAAAVTIGGGLIAIIALLLSFWQLLLSRKATAVSAAMSVHDSLTRGWESWLKAANDAERAYAFGNLMNLLESASLAYLEGMFVGRSKDILCQYLSDTLQTIDKAGLAGEVEPLLQTDRTFQHLKTFNEHHRRH